MECKEIFQELTKCKIKGMMFHSDMADFYSLIGCCVLKKLHECHLLSETEDMRIIKNRFISTRNQPLIIDHEDLNFESIIPKSWEEFDLTDDEIKQWIKRSMETYITYERETKDKFSQLVEHLYKNEHYDDYKLMMGMLDNIILELSHAENLYTYLGTINYNIKGIDLSNRI